MSSPVAFATTQSIVIQILQKMVVRTNFPSVFLVISSPASCTTNIAQTAKTFTTSSTTVPFVGISGILQYFYQHNPPEKLKFLIMFFLTTPADSHPYLNRSINRSCKLLFYCCSFINLVLVKTKRIKEKNKFSNSPLFSNRSLIFLNPTASKVLKSHGLRNVCTLKTLLGMTNSVSNYLKQNKYNVYLIFCQVFVMSESIAMRQNQSHIFAIDKTCSLWYNIYENVDILER